MFDGKRQENGQTIIRHLLILHRATHDDIVVAVAPVIGHTFHKTVDALCEEKEPQVASFLHHPPTFRTPFVRIFQKEIGGEAGEHQLAALNLPRLVTLPLDWQVEVASLSALTARYFTAVHLILAIHITVLASGADLGATMPRIPVDVYFPMLGHKVSRKVHKNKKKSLLLRKI